MKKNILYIIIVAISTMLIASCNRDGSYIATYQTDNGNMSYLKIIHASPYFRNTFAKPDSFNIYINNNKVNSPFLTYGGVFPSTSSNYGYIGLTAGVQQIRLSVNGINNVDSLTIAQYTTAFGNSSYYTWVITDSINSTNTAAQIVTKDTLNPVLAGYYNLRFINAVYSDSAAPLGASVSKNMDLFSYSRNAVLISNIAPSGVTKFYSLNTNIGVADTLYVTRNAATTVPLSSRVVLAKLAITPLNRNYTLYYMGDATLASGTKAKKLLFMANQ
jgi:hypothetical protein